MQRWNPAAVAMPQSGIRLILDEAATMTDVLHLEIGQPDWPTPGHVVEAAARAARNGYTTYTPNAGYWSLREAFASRLSEEQRLAIAPEQVVVSVGAMGAFFSAMAAIVEPGDEVLLPNPGYPNYYMAIQLLGAIAVPYPLSLSSSYELDVDQLRVLITKRTKAIILNAPSNPTGMVASPEALQAVCALADRHGVYLVSDEVYDHIIFEGVFRSPRHFDCGDRVVSIHSCSKTYSMTGWRVGFSVSAIEMARLLTKLQEMFVSCAPSVSQKAAEAALLGSQECVTEMVESYRRRRDTTLACARDLGLGCAIPHGAFYMLIKLPAPMKGDSLAFARRLLKETHVAVAPGVTFGTAGEGFVRISLCTSEDVFRRGGGRLASVLG